MDRTAERLAFLRRYFDALEGFEPVETLGAFLHSDATLIELPHRFAPEGVTRDRATFLAMTAKAKTLFSAQQYTVRSAVVGDSSAALEVDWGSTGRQRLSSDGGWRRVHE
jgi:hypothetical protein